MGVAEASRSRAERTPRKCDDDMDLLRHGAMADLFGGMRASSTLGSFLRSFTWGNVL
jgi:hypothetical protein